MTYRVQLSPYAAKQYKKLPSSIKLQIQTAIDSLQLSPLQGSKIKKLKGRLREYYRCRVGDYRIVYVVDFEQRYVLIDCIQHRKDVYRDLQ